MSISDNRSRSAALTSRYDLPNRAGDLRQLGQLTGSACAVECAEIAERHDGPIMLIAPDMQNALRLRDEIQQFTDQMVTTLSDWETLPYDSFSPHQEIISARLSSLYHLPTMARGIIILPVNTLMQRVCPHEFLHGHALVMNKGQRLSRDKLRAQLEQAGYRSVDQVMEHGEFATRGALLDLYPMGSDEPYRIDFFDDEIDSLRIFDVDTQRTLSEVESINLLPAHEFPTDKNAIELFRSQWREQFEVRRDAEHIYQQVSKAAGPPVSNTGSRCSSASRCRRCSAICRRIPCWLIPATWRALPSASGWMSISAMRAAASTRCARCWRRTPCGCASTPCSPS